MREISFGPVVNPDGSPTEFTKAMFEVRSPKDERDRYMDRFKELAKAIDNTPFDLNDRFVGASLEATRQCIVEMQSLLTQINRVNEVIYQEAKAEVTCDSDCGCGGRDFINICANFGSGPRCAKCDSGLKAKAAVDTFFPHPCRNCGETFYATKDTALALCIPCEQKQLGKCYAYCGCAGAQSKGDCTFESGCSKCDPWYARK